MEHYKYQAILILGSGGLCGRDPSNGDLLNLILLLSLIAFNQLWAHISFSNVIFHVGNDVVLIAHVLKRPQSLL